MIQYLQNVVSVLTVVLVILYPPKLFDSSNSTPITINILNPTLSPIGLCWLSSFAREDEVTQNAPKGCYKIGVGVENTFNLNTFTGHRFIILPWDKEEDDRILPSGTVNSYRKSTFSPSTFLYIRPNMTSFTVEFKSSLATLGDVTNVEDAWQLLLRNRHYFMILLVSIYIVALQYTSPLSNLSPKPNQRLQRTKSKADMTGPGCTQVTMLVPKHSLKCFAVINMLLNHLGYLVFQDKKASLWQLAGTLPADLVGSSQIFWFLVGYHHAPRLPGSSHSHSIRLLVAYFLLEQFCRLPSPFSYDTLFTVVVARSLLSLKVFDSNQDTSGICSFSQLSIWVHCLCCCVLIICNDTFNSNGVRLLQCTGILYAVAGRLFALSKFPCTPSGDWKCDGLDSNGRSTHRVALLLWLLAAWSLQLSLTWKSKLVTLWDDLVFFSLPSALIGACLLGAVGQFMLLSCPVRKPLWTPSNLAVWVSRHSLSIYCSHLMLLWWYYGT